jgi:hypothetical protein
MSNAVGPQESGHQPPQGQSTCGVIGEWLWERRVGHRCQVEQGLGKRLTE